MTSNRSTGFTPFFLAYGAKIEPWRLSKTWLTNSRRLVRQPSFASLATSKLSVGTMKERLGEDP